MSQQGLPTNTTASTLSSNGNRLETVLKYITIVTGSISLCISLSCFLGIALSVNYLVFVVLAHSLGLFVGLTSYSSDLLSKYQTIIRDLKAEKVRGHWTYTPNEWNSFIALEHGPFGNRSKKTFGSVITALAMTYVVSLTLVESIFVAALKDWETIFNINRLVLPLTAGVYSLVLFLLVLSWVPFWLCIRSPGNVTIGDNFIMVNAWVIVKWTSRNHPQLANASIAGCGSDNSPHLIFTLSRLPNFVGKYVSPEVHHVRIPQGKLAEAEDIVSYFTLLHEDEEDREEDSKL